MHWTSLLTCPVHCCNYSLKSCLSDSTTGIPGSLIWGMIMSRWLGVWQWGQEWGIETSFRLRIMDHLLNKFLSFWVVLFLTWGTHTDVEIFAYILKVIYKTNVVWRGTKEHVKGNLGNTWLSEDNVENTWSGDHWESWTSDLVYY
jgi:hypothetical protein